LKLLGNLFRQFALAKVAEGYHLKLFAFGKRLYGLERSASGTRVDANDVRRIQELCYA
jgi:hypothetical protein